MAHKNKLPIDLLLGMGVLILIGLIFWGYHIPRLGLYWDDWSWFRRWEVGGIPASWSYFQDHRPTTIVGFTLQQQMNQYCVQCWHITRFGFHVFGTLLISLGVFRLLSGCLKPTIIFLGAILFMLYPAHLMIATPISSIHLQNALMFFSVSFYLMVEAELSKSPLIRWGGLILALVFSTLYLGYEVNLAFEVFRVVILCVYFAHTEIKLTKQITAVFKSIFRWLPYIVVGVATLSFQVGASLGQGSHNDVLERLSAQNTNTLQLLVNLIWQVNLVFVNAWAIPIRNVLFEMPFVQGNRFHALIAGGLATGIWLVYALYNHKAERNRQGNRGTTLFILMLLGGVVLSLLPSVVFGERVTLDLAHTTRLLFPSAFLASIIFAVLIDRLFYPQVFPFISAILIFISVTTQFALNQHFADHWQEDRLGFWQISWRARSWAEDTLVVVLTRHAEQFGENRVYDHDTFKFIYFPHNRTPKFNQEEVRVIHGDPGNAYWLEQIRKSATGELPADDPYYDLADRLVVITPQYGTSCLHILDGARMELPDRLEGDLIRELTPYSDINRVLVTGQDIQLPTETWGAEPIHDWCYAFQRGSLFRQAGEYEQAIALLETALAQGYVARDRVEWLPFIESYTALGQYEQAYRLVRNYEDVGQRIPQAQIKTCHQQTPDDMIAVMHCIRQPAESVEGYPTSMTWGENVRLHDWQITSGYQYQGCDTLEFESVWSTNTPIDSIYSFSLILASTDGVGLIHAEGAPGGVTPLWKVDVPYTDRRNIALPCDLPEGEYLLLATLSDTATNTPIGSSQYLTTVTVGNS